jgi:hypothetical protein
MAATAMSGPTTNDPQAGAAVGTVPTEHTSGDAREQDERGQQPSIGGVEVAIERHVLAEQLRCGEVSAIPAE